MAGQNHKVMQSRMILSPTDQLGALAGFFPDYQKR
jgi:hypothetical protein